MDGYKFFVVQLKSTNNDNDDYICVQSDQLVERGANNQVVVKYPVKTGQSNEKDKWCVCKAEVKYPADSRMKAKIFIESRKRVQDKNKKNETDQSDFNKDNSSSSHDDNKEKRSLPSKDDAAKKSATAVNKRVPKRSSNPSQEVNIKTSKIRASKGDLRQLNKGSSEKQVTHITEVESNSALSTQPISVERPDDVKCFGENRKMNSIQNTSELENQSNPTFLLKQNELMRDTFAGCTKNISKIEMIKEKNADKSKLIENMNTKIDHYASLVNNISTASSSMDAPLEIIDCNTQNLREGFDSSKMSSLIPQNYVATETDTSEDISNPTNRIRSHNHKSSLNITEQTEEKLIERRIYYNYDRMVYNLMNVPDQLQKQLMIQYLDILETVLRQGTKSSNETSPRVSTQSKVSSHE